jgi:galactose-1-phosphate uridylyltransferase
MEEENIDEYYVLLTESQAESLKEFNENVRRCGTDAEKFSLCGQMHSHLLERHNSLGTFIAVRDVGDKIQIRRAQQEETATEIRPRSLPDTFPRDIKRQNWLRKSGICNQRLGLPSQTR